MDVKNINPVFNAFTNILSQIGFEKIEKKDVSIAKAVLKSKGLLLSVGVVGELKGTIVFEMDIESAKKFASKMMMGMEVTELDSMEQSAISEMSNMVCANACTNFTEEGIPGLNISPPIMMIGIDSTLKLSIPAVISVRYLVDEIEVFLYVGLYKNLGT